MVWCVTHSSTLNEACVIIKLVNQRHLYAPHARDIIVVKLSGLVDDDRCEYDCSLCLNFWTVLVFYQEVVGRRKQTRNATANCECESLNQFRSQRKHRVRWTFHVVDCFSRAGLCDLYKFSSGRRAIFMSQHDIDVSRLYEWRLYYQ